jgi:hypothetical protein
MTRIAEWCRSGRPAKPCPGAVSAWGTADGWAWREASWYWLGETRPFPSQVGKWANDMAGLSRLPETRVPKPPHRSAGAAIRTRAPPPVTGRGGAGCPGGSNPVSIPGWRGSGEGVRTSVPRVLLSSRSSHVVRRPRCELLVPLWWLGTNGHRVTASGGDCGCRVGRLAAVVSRGCGVHRGRRALSHAKEPGTGRRVCRVGHLCRVAAS